MKNRVVILASRPNGVAQAENFLIQTVDLGPLDAGLVRIRNHYLSIEPAMRGWIADAGNYLEPIAIGSVMRSLATGEVIESNNSAYSPGDLVTGWFGWQEIADVDAGAIDRMITRDELSTALGILGTNGMTAYLGLVRIGAARPGDTVLVTTAAGAVGSAVGQIAKLMGCRTIGIAGGTAKVQRCLTDYGYDVALDYHDPAYAEQVAQACASGINVFYDNVAGPIADAAMPHLAQGARVVVCGTASLDRWDPWPSGPRVERHLLVKRARMEGFVVSDFNNEFPGVRSILNRWLTDGRINYHEDILDGIERCPDALAGVYRGENNGKRLIRLAPANR